MGCAHDLLGHHEVVLLWPVHPFAALNVSDPVATALDTSADLADAADVAETGRHARAAV